MRKLVAFLLLLAVACAGADDPTTARTQSTPTLVRATGQSTEVRVGTVKLLFAGDIMLGRQVEPVAAREGPGLFEKARLVVSSADLAAANLESPLTNRPHLAENPNELEADPELADLLSGAGFDLVSMANNHSGDAGPEGLIDTLGALAAAGLAPIGAGRDSTVASAPREIEVNGIGIRFLAFDATGLGLAATEDIAGVARYAAGAARQAVQTASTRADLVVVSVHGGVEYLTEDDPILGDIAEDLVGWGADVVWGHGPHVPQPVSVIEGEAGRSAVVATSLGNFLFDQQRPPTRTGLLLEVLASPDGVEAFRVGRTDHSDLRVDFTGWEEPKAQAVLLNNEWWSLVTIPELARPTAVEAPDFPHGDVFHAGRGDVTGDGQPDLVVSYRHPFRGNEVNSLYAGRDFADEDGRSAHLGVFDTETMKPRWAAGTLLRPVAELAVCDGSLALAFDELDSPNVIATGAWVWWDFGFATAPELSGGGEPGCSDVDRDGRSDPVILR